MKDKTEAGTIEKEKTKTDDQAKDKAEAHVKETETAEAQAKEQADTQAHCAGHAPSVTFGTFGQGIGCGVDNSSGTGVSHRHHKIKGEGGDPVPQRSCDTSEKASESWHISEKASEFRPNLKADTQDTDDGRARPACQADQREGTGVHAPDCQLSQKEKADDQAKSNAEANTKEKADA